MPVNPSFVAEDSDVEAFKHDPAKFNDNPQPYSAPSPPNSTTVGERMKPSENDSIITTPQKTVLGFSETEGTLITPQDKEWTPGLTDDDDEKVAKSDLLYNLEQNPVWYMCIFFGFQHYLIMVVATISVPIILTPYLCIEATDPARGMLICTIIFVSGLITLLQTTFGVRLAIIQGGTFSFLVPTIALLTTAFPKCEDMPLANMTAIERQEEWQVRIRAVQGCIIVAGVCQLLLGFTGLVGILLTWITPLTLSPTIVLIGLTFFNAATDLAAQHWGISCFTIALMLLFSQFLRDVNVPIPAYSRIKGFHIIWSQVFQLFSLLLSILLSWFLCYILTISGALSETSNARSDLTPHLITDAPWVTLPYPGQWGMPTVSIGGVLGMLSGMFASMIESIGDYYANARVSGAIPPPTHAVNRGIGMEGVGGILAGMFGTGNGTTSYSINTGAIGITKVGSRRVIQVAAIFMLLFGMFGKFGAVFVTIPTPVIGGMYCVLFSVAIAIGFSPLQFIDLASTRNLFILGFSIFMGLSVPKWMERNPDVIDTGYIMADQLITVLLRTSMFIGGVLGCFLDNLVPGTQEERGLVKWKAQFDVHENQNNHNPNPINTYDLPFIGKFFKRALWTRYLPFMPTFQGFDRKKRNEAKL